MIYVVLVVSRVVCINRVCIDSQIINKQVDFAVHYRQCGLFNNTASVNDLDRYQACSIIVNAYRNIGYFLVEDVFYFNIDWSVVFGYSECIAGFGRCVVVKSVSIIFNVYAVGSVSQVINRNVCHAVFKVSYVDSVFGEVTGYDYESCCVCRNLHMNRFDLSDFDVFAFNAYRRYSLFDNK